MCRKCSTLLFKLYGIIVFCKGYITSLPLEWRDWFHHWQMTNDLPGICILKVFNNVLGLTWDFYLLINTIHCRMCYIIQGVRYLEQTCLCKKKSRQKSGWCVPTQLVLLGKPHPHAPPNLMLCRIHPIQFSTLLSCLWVTQPHACLCE